MCRLFIIGPTHHHHSIVMKHIFYIIWQHESLFDTKAAWSYFEAGYGKGPWDGLGVTTKRMADNGH